MKRTARRSEIWRIDDEKHEEAVGPAAGPGHDLLPGRLRRRHHGGGRHRRFSFPAAFTQSQVQLRSKGSWLLGLSAFAGRIDTGSDVVPGASKSRLLAINVAVGGGYAYNLVLKRKWLIHLSAMPHIVVYSRNKLTVGDVRQRSPFRFPSLINIGRFAAVRNFKNSFIGMSAVVNLWHQGDSGEMMIESVKWRARLFYGVRF